jgi:Flp pilus assembly protein TadD
MTPLKTNASNGNAGAGMQSAVDRLHKSQARETIVLQEHKSAPNIKKHESSTIESQALYNQAMEYMNRNRYKRAIELLKEALHIAPDNPYYLSYLGLCVGYVGDDFDTAVTLCKRALVLSPGDAAIHVNLGKVYKLKGDLTSAYSTFLSAWRRNKGHPAPAAELSRLGIRRPPVLSFLDRSHILNKYLGVMRSRLERLLRRRSPF